MDKPFKSIDEQIAILESRGLECDNNTRIVLEREGFDRSLRLLMFEYFNKAEAVLKTVCSYRFAMAHKDSPEAYLDRGSYRADAGYRKKIDTLISDFEKVLCRSQKWKTDY